MMQAQTNEAIAEDEQSAPVAGAPPGPPREFRFPDFLGIGAQKAGTTWLDKNLRNHPDIWLPPVKELHFFDELRQSGDNDWRNDNRKRRGTTTLRQYFDRVRPESWNYRYIARLADMVSTPVSDRWYARIFALARAHQVCGEFTPEYSTLPDVSIQHAVALSPQVKVILSLRDPIERSWSHIRMLARTQEGVDLSKMERLATNKSVFKRSNYPAIIERWRRHVPADRLLVVFLDDIVSAPDAVLRQACAFLGVEFDARLFGRPEEAVHVGPSKEIPRSVLTALKASHRSVYKKMGELYPEVGARWAAKYY